MLDDGVLVLGLLVFFWTGELLRTLVTLGRHRFRALPPGPDGGDTDAVWTDLLLHPSFLLGVAVWAAVVAWLVVG